MTNNGHSGPRVVFFYITSQAPSVKAGTNLKGLSKAGKGMTASNSVVFFTTGE